MSFFKRDQEPSGKQTTQRTERPPLAPRPEPVERVRPIPTVASTVAPTPEPTAAPSERVKASTVNRENAAILDRNTDLTGTLHSQCNVLIEGCFQGEIDAKETIWVEEGARTQGQLHSNEAVISGSFEGEVDCQHRLQITETAAVSGEIKTPVLIVEEGATINCRFSMPRVGR